MKPSIKMDMDLLLFIVNQKEGNKIMDYAREDGILGGTIFLAEGTAKSGLLRVLGLDSIRKEVVMIVAPSQTAEKTLEDVAQKKRMDKRNHGIGVRLPLQKVMGLKNKLMTQDFDKKDEHRVEKEEEKMYQATFVVVDMGDAEEVMDVAEKSGARGGTVLRGRGAGSAEASRVFNMEIEPEKDVLFIITKEDVTEQITDSISDYLNIEEANTGILFTVDLSETRGIYG